MRATTTITRSFSPLATLAIAATLPTPAIRASAESPKPTEQLVSIEGKVLDEFGQPVAGVTARMFAGEKTWECLESTAITDSEGRYRFSVAQERLILHVVADDLAGDRQGYAKPLVHIGQLPATIDDIRLKPARRTIVKVVDAKGDPVDGATVLAPDSFWYLSDFPLTAKTGASGIARFRYTDDALVHKLVAFKSGDAD